MKTLLWGAAAAVLLTSGCSMQANRTADDDLTDAKFQQMVKTRLQGDASISRLDLGVAADAAHHAVQLSGTAYTERQRMRAVEIAKGVREGTAVADKIEVKPYAIPRDLFDDEMMQQARTEAEKMGDKVGSSIDDAWLHTKVVAQLIADTKTPERKINVDVTDKVVTLRGTVPTVEAKQQAGAIAKGVDGVKEVYNNLKVKG